MTTRKNWLMKKQGKANSLVRRRKARVLRVRRKVERVRTSPWCRLIMIYVTNADPQTRTGAYPYIVVSSHCPHWFATIGSSSKPPTAAKSGNSKNTAAKTVPVHATSSDSDDSDRLALYDSGNGHDDEDSSDRGSANGDSDIARLSEREAQQVLNNEVLFLYSYITLSSNDNNSMVIGPQGCWESFWQRWRCWNCKY